MEPAGSTVPAAPRLATLDAARGLAVLGMLAANLVNVFLERVPAVLTHNQGDVLRPFDLPAPIFQFLVGVSLPLFLARQQASGATPASARVAALRRFVLLILLGLVLDGVGSLQAAPKWGVLQTLGLGGALATLLASCSDVAVGSVAIALLAVFHAGAWGEVHGGPVAALAFAPLTLAGMVVGRGWAPRGSATSFVRRAVVVGTVAFALAAGIWAGGVPFNKVVGTGSFVALSAAVAVLALLVVHAMRGRLARWLLVLGANALTTWVLLYVLVYYPAWIAFPDWSRLALAAGMTAVAGTLTALTVLTVSLGRRGIRVPI